MFIPIPLKLNRAFMELVAGPERQNTKSQKGGSQEHCEAELSLSLNGGVFIDCRSHRGESEDAQNNAGHEGPMATIILYTCE